MNFERFEGTCLGSLIYYSDSKSIKPFSFFPRILEFLPAWRRLSNGINYKMQIQSLSKTAIDSKFIHSSFYLRKSHTFSISTNKTTRNSLTVKRHTKKKQFSLLILFARYDFTPTKVVIWSGLFAVCVFEGRNEVCGRQIVSQWPWLRAKKFGFKIAQGKNQFTQRIVFQLPQLRQADSR